MRGHADIREFLDAVWKAFPDLTFEMIEGPYVMPGEPRSAVYARGRATHTGRPDPPGVRRDRPAVGGDSVTVGEYRDGRICRLRIFVDMLGVSRQLELMPPVGCRTERAMAGAQRAATKLRDAIRRLRPLIATQMSSVSPRQHTCRAPVRE